MSAFHPKRTLAAMSAFDPKRAHAHFLETFLFHGFGAAMDVRCATPPPVLAADTQCHASQPSSYVAGVSEVVLTKAARQIGFLPRDYPAINGCCCY